MAIRVKNTSRVVLAVAAPIDWIFQPEEAVDFPYIEWDKAINTKDVRKAEESGLISIQNLDPVPSSGDGIYGGSGSLSGATTIAMGTNILRFDSTGVPGLLTLNTVNNLVGINGVAPQAHLDVNGSVAKHVISINSDRVIGDANAGNTDYTLLVDAGGANRAITLPIAANNVGRVLVIKAINTNGGANSITVSGNGTETIDGALTWATTTQWNSIMIQCNGTEWFVL